MIEAGTIVQIKRVLYHEWKGTNEAQAIAQIKQVLDQKNFVDDSQLREDIRFVRRLKDFKRYGVVNKEHKQQAQKIVVALRRLQIALENSAEWLVRDFPLNEIDFARWRKRLEATAQSKLPKPNRADQAKWHAGMAAANLLVKYGLPLKVSRRGQWCRIAALIYGVYGEPRADMLRACAYIKKTRRVEQTRTGLKLVPVRV